LELVALVAGHDPPQQAEDQQPHDHAEADLVFTRPRADVVEVELLERHLPLAHDAAPSSAADSAGMAGSSSTSGASSTVCVASTASAAGSATAGSATAASAAMTSAAGAESTGGTASGIPSPSTSVGAFGLAS